MADPVLSGEFTVSPYEGEEGGFEATFMGNDEATDVGGGAGETIAEAMEESLRDFLRKVGVERVGEPSPTRRA